MTAVVGLAIGFGGGLAALALAFSGPEIRAAAGWLRHRGGAA